MKLTDESTYELMHSKLHALELSDDAVMETTTGSKIRSGAILHSGTLKQTSASTMVYTQDQSKDNNSPTAFDESSSGLPASPKISERRRRG